MKHHIGCHLQTQYPKVKVTGSYTCAVLRLDISGLCYILISFGLSLYSYIVDVTWHSGDSLCTEDIHIQETPQGQGNCCFKVNLLRQMLFHSSFCATTAIMLIKAWHCDRTPYIGRHYICKQFLTSKVKVNAFHRNLYLQICIDIWIKLSFLIDKYLEQSSLPSDFEMIKLKLQKIIENLYK